MCGIAGILGDKARNPRVVREMTDALAHRGPDDQGTWADDEAGIALGHRRLSIVDLSPAGHEPMHSASGRFVLTFNGEIYNFEDLRNEIEARGAAPEGGWRGHSDTEVFLEAIALWGIEAALAKSVGMFAFALWDRRERVLTLARDRFGEKPLYYGWAGNDLVFGSELKALRAHPSFEAEIDRNAVRLFASRAYVPAPLSIYRRVFKLPSGCLIEITPEAAKRPLDVPPAEGTNDGGLNLKRYWSYSDVVTRGLGNPIPDERDALEQLDQALASSVRGQSFADVPVGAFLSGGIDSSTVVALYQKHSTIPVRTFSIGFAEAGFNEAEHAKAVAAHLGTVHEEHYVSAAEAREIIPVLPAMYDEPFADSSQIPTHLVSRFARQQVTVALTGDGGDELFGGYNRHVLGPSMWRRLSKVPRPLRKAARLALGDVSPSSWNRAASILRGERQPGFGSKIQRGLSIAASASSLDDVYRSFLDEWAGGPSPVLGTSGYDVPLDLGPAGDAPDAVRMMSRDAVSYLPDDILCKVDRASMAVSLETRVPFLDHRVAELAARIPISMKIRGRCGKYILRKLLGSYLPKEMIDRPKSGFAIPVGEWIKGPLRDWAEDLLDPRSIGSEGWFDPEIVSHRWRDHLAGRRDSTVALWSILQFQAWLREQESGPVGRTETHICSPQTV
jgi:asparagine synthase (glutamine-hydrolysing)